MISAMHGTPQAIPWLRPTSIPGVGSNPDENLGMDLYAFAPPFTSQPAILLIIIKGLAWENEKTRDKGGNRHAG